MVFLSGELLRTLGFSSAPGILRLLGLIPGLTVVVFGLVYGWMLVATVVAVRQALDYTSTVRAFAVRTIGGLIILTTWRTGRCVLVDRPRDVLLLFPVSTLFWWHVEYLNRFAQNWSYVGIESFGPWPYVWYATLPSGQMGLCYLVCEPLSSV